MMSPHISQKQNVAWKPGTHRATQGLQLSVFFSFPGPMAMSSYLLS